MAPRAFIIMDKHLHSALSLMWMANQHRNSEPMIFDWITAAYHVKKFKPQHALVELQGDQACTGQLIRDWNIVNHYYTPFLSTWASPTLILIDGECTVFHEHCYLLESDDKVTWDARETCWPEESLEILGDMFINSLNPEKVDIRAI